MTDAERLDFLDGITRETNSRMPTPPAGWVVHLHHGAVCLSDDFHRPRSIRQAIDDYREACKLCTEVFIAQTRDEDVRALALEHEERQAFGRFESTEDDISPGN